MSSVSGIRLPGLATGMDTEATIKEMLTGDQNKIDKVKQKEQTIKWQQELYREIIKDVKGFNDKYFSVTSKDSIINSSAWNTLSVSSKNPNVITATGTAGANNINYKYEVSKLAQPPKFSVSEVNVNGTTVKLQKNTDLKSLGLDGEKTFMISYGEGVDKTSKPITIKSDDTIETLAKKINEASGGNVKASFSQMTGELSIESSKTGENSTLQMVELERNANGEEIRTLTDSNGNTKDVTIKIVDGKEKIYDENNNEVVLGEKDKLSIKTVSSDALIFLGINSSKKTGENSEIKVTTNDGKIINLKEESNTFTIDGIKYDVHSTGTTEITSKQDVQPVIDKMKVFVEDYNKLMDKIYGLVTQKTNRDYPPLTEAQKEDMSEEEIEKWEKKAKDGILRNDSEMRRFMDDMQKSIFGDNMSVLNEMGLTSHPDYNKKGQIALDETKFTEALQNNGENVYKLLAGNSNSVMENMKSTINKYAGGSNSVFARKAGLEKTASAVNNFYSEQLKRQAEMIKTLQRKMNDKENQLYKKFATLESNMNKFNSQMNYFAQM